MTVQIYLAGGFYQHYKDTVLQILPAHHFTIVDPEKMSGPQYPGHYVQRDLDAINASNLMIAYHEGDHAYGMAAEMGYAAAISQPIIYVCLAHRVDSFLSGLARATFTNLTAACEFVRKRY